MHKGRRGRELHGFVGRVYLLLTLLSRLGENVQGGFDVALIKRDGGIN